MPNFTVTRRFHRDSGANLAGDVVVSTVLYRDLEQAIERNELINRRYDEVPYHVTGVVLDSSSFCLFDLSELSEALPGFDSLPWIQTRLAA